MLINAIILLAVSVAPVLLLGMYIYKKDKNKEPKKLLMKLFVGGVLSCFLTLIITIILGIFIPYIYVDSSSLNLLELLIHVFVGIALIEEFSKWFMSYIISYNHKEFEQIYDMIVYSAFVALGFAFFENLLYVFQKGISVGILRALLAVPGHACDGIFMGYYLGLAKQSQVNGRSDLKRRYLTLSILVPTLMHGIYDYCLFAGLPILLVLFVIFVVVVYILTIKKIKKISKVSVNISALHRDNFCGMCGTPVQGPFCANCGKKHNY